MRQLLLIACLLTFRASAQDALNWTKLPPLPGGKGWAGMYAGVSNGALIALGGANFPAQPPWKGGKKKWYDDVYVLEEGKNWRKIAQKLPEPSGYGVTITHRHRIILIGGSTGTKHLRRVLGYEWNGNRLDTIAYPPLPKPLANAAGALLGEVVVIAGGVEWPGGPALRTCLALDLNNPSAGWTELAPWPGKERQFPACGVYEEHFFLFSGETVGQSAAGEPYRLILQDGYRLRLTRESDGRWSANWQPLAPMPRGAAAAGTVLPLLRNGRFLIWGGVDAVTALHKNPATHPGINPQVLTYVPRADRWESSGHLPGARVTLPVVFWKKRWVYVSGEVKPGVRTPSVVGVEALTHP